MNEKFNKNAKVEKLAKKVGRGVRLIVIGPYIVWLRITDEGSVPEMRIWSISLI